MPSPAAAAAAAVTTVGVRGVVVLLHGCSHQAGDFFAGCDAPFCLNLPVERRIRETLLSANIAVVAVSSSDKRHRCWGIIDMPRIRAAVDFFAANLSLAVTGAAKKKKDGAAVPLFLFGISSGGAAAASFALTYPGVVAKLVLEISAARERDPRSLSKLPPVFFITMQRDASLTTMVQKQAARLEQSGAGATVRVAAPRRISSPTFFYDFGAVPTADLSVNIVASLAAAKWVDADGYLLRDPRRDFGENGWRPHIHKVFAAANYTRDSLVADASAVSEVLNLLYGIHEITEEYVDEAAKWLLT